MSLGYNENTTAQNNNTVPATLITELAKAHFADKEADRQLARDLMGQFAQITTAMVGVAIKMEEERRHERREERRAQG